MACDEMTSTPLNLLGSMVNKTFDWRHPMWKEGQLMVSKIPARIYDRDGADTLHWLNTVVAPALMKAHQTGLIVLSEWIGDNLPYVP